MNHFVKSHGLGNEYILFNSDDISFRLSESNIRILCDVHYGIGSDGILLKVPSEKADFGLRIFNPDGSEAEKSGNGLRIFAKFIYDYKYTDSTQFSIETAGGIVNASVVESRNNKARIIKVDMGKAIFESKLIPVNINEYECMDHIIEINDHKFSTNCVSVGNPHCIIISDSLSIDEVKEFGPLIENFKIFPNRINVQFVKIIDRNNVEILIWERGAGFTLASGSSSCGVAAVLIKKGLIDSTVTIKMPGGILKINIDDSWKIQMTGEVKQVADGYLDEELLDELK